MKMKEKLVWRLTKLPTVEEITLLIEKKVINEEDAKNILFSSEIEETRDKESLQSEIKFLRELVDKLTKNKTEIITVIKEIETPYYKQPWIAPYKYWCGDVVNEVHDTMMLCNLSGTKSDMKNGSFNEIITF
jgi:hypothetical protein